MGSAIQDILCNQLLKVNPGSTDHNALSWLMDAFPGAGLVKLGDVMEVLKDGFQCLVDKLHIDAAPAGTRAALFQMIRQERDGEFAAPAAAAAPAEQPPRQQTEAIHSLLEAITQKHIAPPPAEWENTAHSDKEKTDMQDLIDKACYGQPGDDWWPSSHILERVSKAAGFGDWSPPEATPAAAPLLQFMKSLIPVLHAEIWQSRSTPATALNQLALCLDIATNPKMSKQEAEQCAVQYVRALRGRVFKFSRHSKFHEPSDPNFASAQSAFVTPDLALLQGLKSWVDEGADVGGKGKSGAENSHARGTRNEQMKDLCMWHAIAKCNNKHCQMSHGPCPFCGGKCGSKPGYLSLHLKQLKTPRKIVPANEGEHSGASHSSGSPTWRDQQWGEPDAKRQKKGGKGKSPW